MRRPEIALDLFHELEVQLQQPPQEPDHERPVAKPRAPVVTQVLGPRERNDLKAMKAIVRPFLSFAGTALHERAPPVQTGSRIRARTCPRDRLSDSCTNVPSRAALRFVHECAPGANLCTNAGVGVEGVHTDARPGGWGSATPSAIGGEEGGATACSSMGRHLTQILSVGDAGPEWSRRYRCEWGEVVGGRVRRLREARGLTLAQVAGSFQRPDGGHYSPGFLSRLERGWASPPLWVYVVLAEHFDVEPGRLLGPDHVATGISEAEVMLLRLLRRLRVEPDEAIARLVRVDGTSAGDGVTAV
jgi:transcriptional regulator with XRE-family HTH domain